MATTTLIKLDDHEKRIGALEKNDVKQDERIDTLRTDCKDFEDWRTDVDKIIVRMDVFIGAGKWIVASIGVFIIALLWAIFTHQVTLAFK